MRKWGVILICAFGLWAIQGGKKTYYKSYETLAECEQVAFLGNSLNAPGKVVITFVCEPVEGI